MTKAFLLAGAAGLLLVAGPVRAQSPAAQVDADERAALRAEIARLKSAVAALEARLDKADGVQVAASPPVSPPAASPAAKPAPVTETSWKGSPQFTQGDAKFKVKGRLQMDATYLSTPAGVNDRATGFASEFRRLRLGGEGALGSGFGYKLEFELSDNSVDLVDGYVNYQRGPWLVMLGNHNSFQSLDELISDTAGSVMERAAFTDAFGFERRLGLSVQYQHGPLLAQGGVFTDSPDAISNDADGVAGGDENDSFSLDGRLVYAPKLGKAQLHFAGSYHWRELNRLSEGTQRYRQRPYLHAVNSRFLATPALSVDAESHYGVEAAGVLGRFHYAGEAHWMTAFRPGAADPTFFGAYGEVGFFLTPGDSRPYANGILGTPKPAHPFGKGGPGAIQLNLRYDYLTLDDRSAGINGGKQNGVIIGLVWTPIQYLRFNVNYAHMSYLDAAIAAGSDRDYGVDAMAVRAELDF